LASGIRFLNASKADLPAGKIAHVILDNYATHKHQGYAMDRCYQARGPCSLFQLALALLECQRSHAAAQQDSGASAKAARMANQSHTSPSGRDSKKNRVLGGTGKLKPPSFLRLCIYFPILRRLPARLIALGVRRERVTSQVQATVISI
jgi:hypothetical protein